MPANPELDTLARIRLEHSGLTIGLRKGVYDLDAPHKGHRESLQYAKSLVDFLVVAVVNDEDVKARKGPTRPRVPGEERVLRLREARSVDHAFLLPSYGPGMETASIVSALIALRPDKFFINPDTQGEWQGHIQRHGLQLDGMQFVPHAGDPLYSTTNTITALLNAHRESR